MIARSSYDAEKINAWSWKDASFSWARGIDNHLKPKTNKWTFRNQIVRSSATSIEEGRLVPEYVVHSPSHCRRLQKHATVCVPLHAGCCLGQAEIHVPGFSEPDPFTVRGIAACCIPTTRYRKQFLKTQVLVPDYRRTGRGFDGSNESVRRSTRVTRNEPNAIRAHASVVGNQTPN
jgi:hypothetical protein